jgi:hypothetical protein
MSTDKERNYLSKLYPGYSWQDKVSKMTNERVIAIYLRFQRDGPPKIEPKLMDLGPEELKPKNPPEDPPDNQITLF